jgi:hypothetical protein
MYPFTYSSFFGNDSYIFKDSKTFNQLLKEGGFEFTISDIIKMGDKLNSDAHEAVDTVFAIIDENFFQNKSNIGGYGHTPQGQTCIPLSAAAKPKDAQMLFLSDDIISWGDGGAIWFWYKDITRLKKDASLSAYGDMS